MAKAKRYNVIISEEKRIPYLGKIQETSIDHFDNVTINKMQLLVGRFVIEHNSAVVKTFKNNSIGCSIGLVLIATEYNSERDGSEKVIRLTVKEEA